LNEDNSFPTAITVSDRGIFWAGNGGAVRRLPLEGGNLRSIAYIQSSTMYSFGIAVNSSRVFWTVQDSVQGSGVMVAELDKPGAANWLYNQQSYAYGIAATETTLFWADESESDDKLLRASTTGGTPEVLWSDVFAGPVGVAIDSSHVYWTTQFSSEVKRRPLDSDSLDTIAKDQKVPYAIALSDKAVYWTNLDNPEIAAGEVMMLPKNSGGEPVVLATGQKAPSSIAVDENGVYWTNLGEDPGSPTGFVLGSVMKLPLKDGLPIEGATPIVLATEQSSPTSIAVHKGIVYWCNYHPGEILSVVP
jgi:hypothetical protein